MVLDNTNRSRPQALLLAALAFVLASCASIVRPLSTQAAGAQPRFPYDDWALVLEQHVDPISGRVDYAALEGNREPLNRFYSQIAALSPDSHPEVFATGAQRLAYWINAYNATVLYLVLHHRPLGSVQDVRTSFSCFFPDGAGFFYFTKLVYGGRPLSLYALENDVIRERFEEPRVHFVLNCASIGCPRLPAAPLLADSLEQDLERETRRFFAEERNLRIDHATRTIWLSSILEWYADDFTQWLARNASASPATLTGYAGRYAPEAAARELRAAVADGYAVRFAPYDWGLNAR